MNNLRWNSLIRASFVVAPTFLFLYGIAHWIDGLDGIYGPGMPWIIGHVMFFLGLVSFGFVMIGLYQYSSPKTSIRKFIAGLALILGLIGLIIFVRVSVIDILTGFFAKDHATMGIISGKLNAYPSVALVPFYNIGPLLFQLGMITLMIQLAVLKPRKLQWWNPITLLLGFLILGFNLNFLLVGAIVVGIALLPLALQ